MLGDGQWRAGRWIWACSLVATVGCYGGRTDVDGAGAGDSETDGADGDGGADDAGDGDMDGPYACDPSAIPESLSLRRLSRTQYDNAVRDLLVWAAGDAGAAIHADVANLIDRLPEDARRGPEGEVQGGFRRLDQDVHQEHINAGYDVGVAVGQRLSQSHLSQLAGPCATDADPANDAACVDDFIRRFGSRALRRPITDEQVAFYRSVFEAGGVTQGMEPEAFADVIVVMMTAPQFMYMVEHGAEEVDSQPGVYALDAYELASRLSFHFWQTSPDDELYAAAASGELMTEDGYAEQVDRMFADPRTAEALGEFYREWLWLEDLPAVDSRLGTAVFDAFRGDFEPTPETTSNMVQEVVDMATYYTLTADGTFEDLMTSNRSFATTPDVAQIYETAVWDGSGEPPQFPQPERVGLISRAALTATGSSNTRPIMKGVFIRLALLCDHIPPPPDNANAMPPELSPDATTREVVEALTEQQGTACAGCHAGLINPLGYATENFDALGRFRTEQVLFDDNGVETGRRAVDASSVPRLDPDDDSVSNGAGDLSRMLVDTGRVHACFARHYVRWTFGREEDLDRDGCMLNGMTSSLVEGAPIAEGLRQLALRDEFKTRLIEQ